MTDLEITRLCAEALGVHLCDGYDSPKALYTRQDCRSIDGFEVQYRPIHDDAQAMALVKKFVTVVLKRREGDWSINLHLARSADLNRAICECVAKMQQAKGGGNG